MGRAATLEEKSKSQQEVIDLFAQETTQLQNALKPEVDAFNAETDKFYEDKKWKMLELGSGTKANYSDSETFSLEGIEKILGTFATAIFDPASAVKPPEGTKVDKGALDTVASAGMALSTYETLAIKAATGLVLSLFGAFDTSTKKETHLSSTHSMLAPGLMLHAYSVNSSFTKSDFFGGREVIVSQATFRLVYSLEQAKGVAEMEVMKSMTDQLHDYIELLAGYMASYKIKFKDISYAIEHADQKVSYEKVIAAAQKNRDDTAVEIGKFVPKAPVVALVNNLRPFVAFA
ncbi:MULTISPECIES: hypothetical protein [unclassified Variovorax]|uniref:hypothetical protein n=1 Tax=unclassified Variovorax TaxID=663243 RepID=UPI00076BD5E8|nr:MULTISPECIES: hypothetical protein [unclassified Variovorax]KWT98592.1 hypothetical protein APY03_0339 [Variovorax sp. WDL1]PNG46737.1 hypothetical protein CHC06_07080 [Variovorax sp. B2]PNG48612.1 hypothetical protein CHC07_07788 [Variovorax sp. B4]VTV14530.1 hypothetical protein WDL1CHR_05053 [Variovorax sp. WDL1]